MFDARKGQITITRGDTGLLAIVPTGYVPTSQDRMFFMVAEMPDGRIVINKTVTPDDDGVCKLMFPERIRRTSPKGTEHIPMRFGLRWT